MANNTDWLNISQMTGGTGETALSLTALTNDSLQPKTATITARNSQYNVSDTTTVTIQGFQPTLTLSRSTLRFDSTGGTATFTVYSNTAWTINFPALVHSYSTSAGTGDTEVTVVLAPNLDEVGKVDTGTVQDIFGVNQLYLTIVQESFITELTVTPDDDIIFVNTGSGIYLTIDTNTDWELECPDWVYPTKFSGGSGTTMIFVAVGENGPTDRSGEITVYAGSKSVTINVFQPFYIPPYLTVTPSAWTFNYTEDGKTFVVDSYPEWRAEVITSAETVWTSTAYMEAIFDIPSAMTMPLYVGSSGSTIGTYLGPIIHYGSSVTFESGGTYKIRYEMASNGSTPILRGNQYLKEIILSDKVGAIQASAFTGCTALTSVTIGSGLSSVGAAAFSGCSSLNNITIAAQTAPSVCADTFYGVASGGTLHYPADSDYSSWLSKEQYYLAYAFWNNLSPNLYFQYTVTYNVTSTGNTKILADWSNGGGDLDYPILVNFVRDEQGNIIPLEKGQTTFRFSSTGKQQLDLSTTGLGVGLNLSGVTAAVDLQINNVGTGGIRLSGSSFTGLTLYRNITFSSNSGSNNRVKRMIITGVTDTIPSKARIGIDSLETLELFGDLTSISGSTFSGATNLSSVTMSNKITAIGASCFKGCTSLSNVTIGSGVTSIGANCFSGCTSISSITIPDSVTSLGGGFRGCSSLSSVTIGSGVTSIGDYCFTSCNSLSSITIPNSVTSLGSNCFAASHLSSITIPDSVTSLGSSCFTQSSLASVIIGNGVTTLPYDCFSGCSSLSSVTIGSGVTSIGDGCFGCRTYTCSLSSITIPDSVTGLGEYCFQESAISSITIGSGVTSIGNYCFQKNQKLKSITVRPVVAPSLPNEVFQYCTAGGVLYYPAGSDYSSWFAKLPSGWTGQEI